MPAKPAIDQEKLALEFSKVRNVSLDICAPLVLEDYGVQPCDDASPPKWHLAHTSWFFETFLLKPKLSNYQPYDAAYEYLFNSYYNGVGAQYPRVKRGHLSRPTVAQVESYRAHVNDAMLELLNQELEDQILFSVVLGLNHEQQHQELMFTDIKYNLGHNPLFPAYKQVSIGACNNKTSALTFTEFAGGIYEIGHSSPTVEKFVFDNESPRHSVLVGDFSIADRVVTNGEYLAFIEDGGYQNSQWWLSDAWSLVSGPSGFQQPLYWTNIDNVWYEYTFAGLHPLDLSLPVAHVSGYEADAYSRWFGARLPTEQEWELAAGEMVSDSGANFYESGALHPLASERAIEKAGESSDQNLGRKQFYGDVWEWTSSSYSAYPGFNPFPGQLGEYNGKFMANQLVLRGGSCVTSEQHMRRSYRNFFYPKDRWQFSGIRLAR